MFYNIFCKLTLCNNKLIGEIKMDKLIFDNYIDREDFCKCIETNYGRNEDILKDVDKNQSHYLEKFYNEFVPIYVYMNRYGVSQVQLPSLDGSYDGIFKFDNNIKYVECTTADGYGTKNGMYKRKEVLRIGQRSDAEPLIEMPFENDLNIIYENLCLALKQKRDKNKETYKNAIIMICLNSPLFDNEIIKNFLVSKFRSDNLIIFPFSMLCVFNCTTFSSRWRSSLLLTYDI